ncbi:LCP family protein [Streptomyces sp. NPDC060194]|uniref:LCP family protein n=1 Tax=Streptomyces sp. NPDC060194 TaxID=3347069 RepID=UPI003658A608
MPAHPRPPRPRPRARWGRRVAVTLALTVLGTAAAGHVVINDLDAGIARIDPFRDMKNRPAGGDGMNLLLVGTDGRDTVTAEEKARYRLGGAPCHCTDTLMIVHISADRGRASVVSLPRDSYADLPEHTDRTSGEHHQSHPAKINAAYAEGGPQLTVRTVEHNTGVKIDHYLEVDFASFMKTVDALGGVEICTARPLRDSHTGLDLAPGTHALSGGQALQYARARYVDASGDLGRMQRQQRLLAAMVDKATSSGVLLNPLKFKRVTGAMLGSVRADENFGTPEMLALGQAMRGFSPSSSEFSSVPIGDMDFPIPGVGSSLRWNAEQAERLFAAIRSDEPLAPHKAKGAAKPVLVDVEPAAIRVRVENGTDQAGLGGRVDTALRGAGFATTGLAQDAPEQVERTVVAYDPRWDRSAKSLAAALPGSELREVPGQGGVLRVIAGDDYTGVRKVRVTRSAAQGDVVTGDEVLCG